MNTVLLESRLPEGALIQIVLGDITLEEVDAIVNAANTRLQHGGGVAAAIVRRGGAIIQRESDAIGHVPTGSAAITSAGSLPCRYVIHAVGPIWGTGNEDALLANAVRSALSLAAEHQLQSISIPAISSGIYGFPLERCAQVLVTAALGALREHPERCPKQVRFCLFDQRAAEAFMQALERATGDASPNARG